MHCSFSEKCPASTTLCNDGTCQSICADHGVQEGASIITANVMLEKAVPVLIAIIRKTLARMVHSVIMMK